jgi:hypothetical protein
MLEAILSPPFVCNEWGALLLHQEALSLVRLFDEAGSEMARGKGGEYLFNISDSAFIYLKLFGLN